MLLGEKKQKNIFYVKIFFNFYAFILTIHKLRTV